MEHRLKTLARTKGCKIDHCSCGAIHISVNGTTVRVTADIARELRDSLVRAMAEVDKPVSITAPPPVHLVPAADDDDDGGPQYH